MVSSTKFYIYGGGRWRELDLSDGRVDGWGRARFVYPKRGKVQVAKTGAVLTALRDLGAGKNSAVKDGPHLPHKIKEEVKKIEKKDHSSACEHSRCCHTKNGQLPSKTTPANKVSAGTQCAAKADVSIQTSLPSQTLTFPDTFMQNSRKRRRETTSSDENIPKTVTTNAVVHPEGLKSSKRNLFLKRKRLETISSDENVDGTHKKKIPSLKLHRADSTKYNIYKRKRTKSSDSIVWVVLPKNSQNYVTKGSKQSQDSPKLQSQSTQKITEDIIRVSTKPSSQGQIRKAVAGSNEENGRLNSKLNSRTLLKKDNTSKLVKRDQCKELIIDEQDVEILRNYLVNNATDFDLLKFDQDDEYKRYFFFKINPLVNVELCPKIARILRGSSQDILSVEDFASQLGLKSITEKCPPPKRYKMRKHDKITNYKGKNVSDSNTESSKPYVDRKNKSVNKHKSSGNAKATSSRYSTDSETVSDYSDDYRDVNVVKRSERLNKSLKESNSRDYDENSKTSNRYQTRLSGSNKNNAEVNESNKENARQKNKERDQDEAVELSSSKNLKKGGKKYDSMVVTDTDSETDMVSKKANRKTQNKSIKNKNLVFSTNESSDEDIPETSNKSKKSKKIINSNANVNKADKNSEDDFHMTKNGNTRGLSKEIVNRNKLRRNPFVSDSDKSQVKSSREEKQNGQTKKQYVVDKVFKPINLTIDTSEDEAPSSQNANKNGHNKVNKNEIATASNDAISKQNNIKVTNNKDNTDKNQSNNVTTETLSDNSESEAFIKKPGFKPPIIKEVKSLVVQPKANIGKRPWSALREYSLLEDQAIVTWVSVGGRACCVNGNRIWREFEEQYHRITGQKRSWHSIRNRYLRYVLPGLASMALNPSQVARLRAAAATGEIKSRSKVGRRNSIFGTASRGALSRNPNSRSSTDSELKPPKRHKHDNYKKAKSPSPKRVLRSSLPKSPPNSRRSPRYSEITRHFAVTHRQNDSTPSTSPTRLTRNKNNPSPTKKSNETRNEDGPKKDVERSEESTKESPAIKKSSLRSSLRNKSPAPTINKSVERETKSRKLFNPGSML